LRGTFTRSAAVERLLRGTGIGFRLAGGSFNLVRLTHLPPPDRAAESLPIPEILVIGRRTQNVDIRRSTNDIRPYRVLGRKVFEQPTRDDVNEVLRSKLPGNSVEAAPAQLPTEFGDPRSLVDLRGLGGDRTLVLLDGRRLPSIPTFEFDNLQPDVNALPLIAMERIETITGTAGGTYGPGALGGVVNIILRRDVEGLDLRMTKGISDRSDASTTAIEGIGGFRIRDSGTRLMITGSMRTSSGLLRGQRDYTERQRRRQSANDPESFARLPLAIGGLLTYNIGNAVSVFSADNQPLRLKPEFGGGTLGATYSFLPADFSGSRSEAVELLRANAGALMLEPAPDRRSGTASLLPRSTSASILASLRQEFGGRIEAHIDAAWLRNEGRQEFSFNEQGPTTALAPTNLFQQPVVFTFPRPDLLGTYRQTITSNRVTLGTVIRMGHDWSLNADVSAAQVRAVRRNAYSLQSLSFLNSLRRGTPGGPGLPVVDPLAPAAVRNATLLAYRQTSDYGQFLKNNFRSAGLRLGGPLLNLPGGPLALTSAIEWRRESVPVTTGTTRSASELPKVRESAPRSQVVSSGYLELRAPLTAAGTHLPILRQLELMLALRRDAARTLYPRGFGAFLPGDTAASRSRRTALTYTAGVRFFPHEKLMLRMSSATGELPPTIQNLRSNSGTFVSRARPLRIRKEAGGPSEANGTSPSRTEDRPTRPPSERAPFLRDS
jgi:outer membrane receptor protein involved in Fe transport